MATGNFHVIRAVRKNPQKTSKRPLSGVSGWLFVFYRCSWMAALPTCLLSGRLHLVPAVWCGSATGFVFFYSTDVEPVSSTLVEDLCCLFMLSSATLCKLWRRSPLFGSVDEKAKRYFQSQAAITQKTEKDSLIAPPSCFPDLSSHSRNPITTRPEEQKASGSIFKLFVWSQCSCQIAEETKTA